MAVSTRDVHRALLELGQLRFGDTATLDEAMQRIVQATHTIFGVDGAGLMLIDEEHELRNAAVSDQRLAALEDLQIRHHEGPGIDAFEEKGLVASEDFSTETRWPAFRVAAQAQGLRAVLASPLPYNQQAIGVVVVVAGEPHPWSPEGELALVAFTDLAALLIASMVQGAERSQVADQLQHALDARVVIEQAKGVLVAQQGLSPREAYERIRADARAHRRRLRDHAAEVVAAAQSGR